MHLPNDMSEERRHGCSRLAQQHPTNETRFGQLTLSQKKTDGTRPRLVL